MKYKLLIILLAVFVIPLPTLASTTNGTIDSTYKYAWPENIAWINLTQLYYMVVLPMMVKEIFQAVLGTRKALNSL